MIPNKTEEQIMYQYFKFFDLEGNGYVNLRDFFRANEKIGVVLKSNEEYEDIFHYFDKDHTGLINYRQFCKEMFSQKDKKIIRNYRKKQESENVSQKSETDENIYTKKQGPFFDKLIRLLVQHGAVKMINLYKQFKLTDINNSKKLTIDDFIKLISDNKINLSISDIQYLFHSYEYNNNGYFYYEEMFKDLKKVFWNSNRSQIVSELFKSYNQVHNGITINMFKYSYQPKYHPSAQLLSEERLKEDFINIIEDFVCVKRMTRGNFNLSKNDFDDFFKYFAFGIESDTDFQNIVENCFLIEFEDTNEDFQEDYNQYDNRSTYDMFYNQKKNYKEFEDYYPNKHSKHIVNQNRPKTPVYNKFENSNKLNLNQEQHNQVNSVIIKFKNNLKKFGFKTFLDLIKQFKFYDNGTKLISKYDFSKVLKDFRLNLTIHEIEKIFDFYCEDNKRIHMNYIKFINKICDSCFSDIKRNHINTVTNKMSVYCNSINEKLTTEFLKTMYNPYNNYFNLAEDQAYNLFCDCVDLYHYKIRDNKNEDINTNEIYDYYKLYSFLIEDDDDFIQVINNEWKKIMDENLEEKEYYEQGINNKRDNTKDMPMEEDNIVNSNQLKPNKRIDINYEEQINNNKDSINNNNINNDNVNVEFRNTNNLRNKYQRKPQNSNKNLPIKQSRQDPLEKITNKLKRRGIRGLMNMHKQFIFTCPKLNAINYEEFVKTLSYQRIDLLEEDYEYLFKKFSQETNKTLLNFPAFIRGFKKVLNETRLNAVERAFTILDVDQTENLNIDDIKLKFNAFNHPDVINGIKNEDEIITEFLDCFELNYNLLTTADNPDSSNLVTFEEFANFYEYVSFLYENDKDFINMLEAVWS